MREESKVQCVSEQRERGVLKQMYIVSQTNKMYIVSLPDNIIIIYNKNKILIRQKEKANNIYIYKYNIYIILALHSNLDQSNEVE